MSSDNFDLMADDGRIWQNLSASQYWDISTEAIVVCMELGARRVSDGPSDYTEYGIYAAGPVTDAHRLEAALFLVRQLQWQLKYLDERVERLECPE